jgi:hypothetical protein
MSSKENIVLFRMFFNLGRRQLKNSLNITLKFEMANFKSFERTSDFKINETQFFSDSNRSKKLDTRNAFGVSRKRRF